MQLSLPRPSALVDAAVSVAASVVTAPARVLRLVDGAEQLLARAQQAIDDIQSVTAAATRIVATAEGLTRDATVVVQEASAIAQRAAGIAGDAETVVTQAAETSATAAELVGAYEPAVRRFVENLSPDEVDAAIRMIDELPRLAHHLNADVLPILATLDRVGPDIHELLGVTRDVRQAILGIPGFDKLRRRGAERPSSADGGLTIAG